jgi:short-subunit dehydrogenase
VIALWRRRRLAGARVVVTGASSGIGAALAGALARRQARLVLAARSSERLAALQAQLVALGEVHVLATDVARAEDRARLVDEAVRQLGGIDVLVNNAGVGANGNFLDTTEECLRRIFEVNFFGTTELTRLALPHLLQGNHPLIVNVSSVIGRRAVPGYTEYCSAKFAVCGWSEALRAELKPRGVHVLLVCPGLIETPFRDNLLHDRLQSRARRGRRMSAERCARIIARAMEHDQNELVVTAGGKALLWLNRACPWLVDWMMDGYAKRSTRSRANLPGE